MDTGTYTFDDLKTKYGGFLSPAVEVSVDGSPLDKKYNIFEVKVENTIENDAVSMAVFKVQNAQNIKPEEGDLLSAFPMLKKAEIKLGFNEKLLSVYQGYIFERQISLSGSRMPELTVTCLDNKAFLRVNKSCEVYPEKAKLSDVVEDILGKYPFSKDVTATTAFPAKMSLTRSGGTDFDTVCAAADDVGYEFFSHKDKLYFRKPMSVSGKLIKLTAMDIFDLSVKTSMTGIISKVELYGYNRDTKEAKTVTADAVKTKVGSGSTGAELLEKIPATHSAGVHMSTQNSRDLEALANAYLQKSSMKLVKASVVVPGLPEMIPGRLMELADIEKDVTNTYYIETVKHTQTNTSYTTELICISNTAKK